MAPTDIFRFRLYIAGATPNSAQALTNLKALCRRHLPGRHEIDIVDIFEDPRRALSDRIMLTPTLVKLSPLPEQRFVGTLGQGRLVVEALGLEVPAQDD
ncbi:MAG: circadian clock KaiB family protein [Variovorax sp.]